MTVIALASCRASPGVSALAVGLTAAWRAEGAATRLIEADPSGGVLALRFALPKEPSFSRLDTVLRTLRSQQRPGDIRPETDLVRIVAEHCVSLWGGPCLTAPVDPAVSARAIERSIDDLNLFLAQTTEKTVIDLGRLHPKSPSLALTPMADVTLIVCRPRIEEVQAVLFASRSLRSYTNRIGVVLIGHGPFHYEEVAEVLGAIPVVAVLPDQPEIAAALIGGMFKPDRLIRSSLWDSIADLARTLDVQTTRHPASL